MRELLAGPHNPLSKLAPTGDGAHELLDFFQKVTPDSGALIHDFTDPEWNTRFLGDLYQDLSESARERYALLQTPDFVEEFILDRTLNPAMDEFGCPTIKMIDPACGSGHFLLGGFGRLLAFRMRNEPGVPVRAQVGNVLAQIFGVDLNPFAVAIARFRLLVAALKACSVERLLHAPQFEINVAAGDSLLHGPSPRGLVGIQKKLDEDPLQYSYETEDAERVRQFLYRQYHVVVGNPPYITVKDVALSQAYRARFGSCYRQYSLAVPFKERFFNLAVRPANGETTPAGFVGMITANSFMKREFGKKIVEDFIPRWDLTHVIDTAGAYIPGHGTPTVILIGRNRPPVLDSVRCALGLKGEPSTPVDPSEGLVWRSITQLLESPGFSNEFVTIADIPRSVLSKHPWTLGGGGAVDLFGLVSRAGQRTLKHYILEIGASALTRDDDVFVIGSRTALRFGIRTEYVRPYIAGEDIRDWTVRAETAVLWPYDTDGKPLEKLDGALYRYLWRFRTQLRGRIAFGMTQIGRGLAWYTYSMLFRKRYRANHVIAFANVSTHNHFVFSPGHLVFNAHAPVITLKGRCSNSEYLSLVTLLNSSVACFWLKQVSHNKGSTVDQHGARQRTMPFEDFFEYDVTKLKRFPVPDSGDVCLGQQLQALAEEFIRLSPERLSANGPISRERIQEGEQQSRRILAEMISLQEEIDWKYYHLFGVINEDLCYHGDKPPSLKLGQRAFEIVMARDVAGNQLNTTWFTRHGSTQVVDIPMEWPETYRHLVRRRIELIKSDKNVRLLELPEYKRRWQISQLGASLEPTLRDWLLDRIESNPYWQSYELASCAKIADHVRNDSEFLSVAELFRGRADFDLTALVSELIEAAAVPFLPVLVYRESGQRKHLLWKRTWEMQREQDAIDRNVEEREDMPEPVKVAAASKRKEEEVGVIPIPPKYFSADFQKSGYWNLRGKVDVPKERFVSFPYCERDADPTLVVGWNGWTLPQRARAIAGYYERVKNYEGWTPDRRVPLLTGILELVPWLKQWHNEIHPEFRERMGDYFEQFVHDEARAIEVPVEQIRSWTPPAQASNNRRRSNL